MTDRGQSQRITGSFPVTFGKPSLRRRLEAYYSLVAPSIIQDQEEWKNRFNQIYEKFGGSEQGEQKLAMKLKKKYGDSVRLRVATAQSGERCKTHQSKAASTATADELLIEKSYKLTEEELGSNDINFLSNRFNPYAALYSKLDPMDIIIDKEAPILDNISKACALLPEGDPLRFAHL